jgi:hypothetical protein
VLAFIVKPDGSPDAVQVRPLYDVTGVTEECRSTGAPNGTITFPTSGGLRVNPVVARAVPGVKAAAPATITAAVLAAAPPRTTIRAITDDRAWRAECFIWLLFLATVTAAEGRGPDSTLGSGRANGIAVM